MLRKARRANKLIFSFINEGKKLNLVKYNKYFQKKNDITIINYKLFRGKYILYESNTKVKEYNVFNDILIFEGKYLNGKRNGKVREYYHNGTLKFEGEYLNNKAIIGTQYTDNG